MGLSTFVFRQRVKRRPLDRGQKLLEDISIRRLPSNARTRRRAARPEEDSTTVDWTKLPDDIVIHVILLLDIRDRASLSSTCRSWRKLHYSPFLWKSLDLRSCNFTAKMASLLSSHCENLQKLRFDGDRFENEAILNIRATNVREISGDNCKDIGSILSYIAGGHPALEILDLGLTDRFNAILDCDYNAFARSCLKLRKLKLSGLCDIKVISAFSTHCHNLTDIGLMDCYIFDVEALGSVSSLRFLSVAGTRIFDWYSVCNKLAKLPNLIGLDLSRTDVNYEVVSKLLSSSSNLKVLCALDCPNVRKNATNIKFDELLVDYDDALNWLDNLGLNTVIKEKRLNHDWYTGKKDKDEFATWLECIISLKLLADFKYSTEVLAKNFWIRTYGALVLRLMMSTHDNVQEMVLRVLATVKIDNIGKDRYGRVCGRKSKEVRLYQNKGLCLLLNLAKSQHEGVRSEASKAILNLSAWPSVLKFIANHGEVSILIDLTRSKIKLIAEEAVRRLRDLSFLKQYEDIIIEAGGIRSLVDLITIRYEGDKDNRCLVLYVAEALANLASDEKCSMEIARIGGLHALLNLATNCKNNGGLGKVVRAIAVLFANEDICYDLVSTEDATDTFKAIVRAIAVLFGALLNLSYDEGNLDAIAATGGVEALLALAKPNGSWKLQKRLSGALWALSVSEKIRITVGLQGGIATLVAFAYSSYKSLQENAVGALGNLALDPRNAIHIVDANVVKALIHVCASSHSDVACFHAALALAYIFDGRIEKEADIGFSSKIGFKRIRKYYEDKDKALNQIRTFILSISDHTKFTDVAALMKFPELFEMPRVQYIIGDSHLRFSETEIRRLVGMLRGSSSELSSFAIFAIFQLASANNIHRKIHLKLLKKAGRELYKHDTDASTSANCRYRSLTKEVFHP